MQSTSARKENEVVSSSVTGNISKRASESDSTNKKRKETKKECMDHSMVAERGPSGIASSY